MAAADSPPRHVEPTLLERIRNMSEFAALMQYLFFFGKAVKAEELDVEVGAFT
jgi:DNA-directed RNA polymerase